MAVKRDRRFRNHAKCRIGPSGDRVSYIPSARALSRVVIGETIGRAGTDIEEQCRSKQKPLAEGDASRPGKLRRMGHSGARALGKERPARKRKASIGVEAQIGPSTVACCSDRGCRRLPR